MFEVSTKPTSTYEGEWASGEAGCDYAQLARALGGQVVRIADHAGRVDPLRVGGASGATSPAPALMMPLREVRA